MEIGEMNIIVKIPSFRKYTDNEKSFTVSTQVTQQLDND